MRAVRVRVVLLALAGAAILLGAASAAGGGGNPEPKLSKHAKELLAARVASGAAHTTLLIASQAGSNSSVASAIESQGGVVRYRDDELDYTRASVPTPKVERIASLPGIEIVDLDEKVPLADATEAAAPAFDLPGPTTPAQNPFLPTRDIGGPQFTAAHPTYDGRGVTIGILDTGVDVLTPELQTAKTLDGTPVRKIRDWITTGDPVEGDPTWLDMNTELKAKGGAFTVEATTYRAPRNAGTFSFATFAEQSLAYGQLRDDLNRDGDKSDIFAVLWDQGDSVWVDTNQNQSFADEREMREYGKRFDVGLFGTDNPATHVRESVPFVVQIAKKDSAVNIGIASDGHGTHVAGIAAGKDFFGAPDHANDANFDGAAPEAQIVFVRGCDYGGCGGGATFEGLIYLVKTAKVDTINASMHEFYAAFGGVEGGAFGKLVGRLARKYRVQMFFSAGNDGPGEGTVSSGASQNMSVGAYVHADTWLSNYFDTVAAKSDGLFVFSSRGPSWDGGLKPQIVAPGSAFSTVPGWWPRPTTFPAGYAFLEGTSMSAPQATGGAALLISAAKQLGGIPFGPDELRQAINSGARHLPAYGVFEQGYGLMDVGHAWNVLVQKVRPVQITSSVPIKTLFPVQRLGINEREGWRPGNGRIRSITLTRLTPGSDTYNLSWSGNDGTFGPLPPSVFLRSGAPVTISVTVSTATAGVHSALLRVDDPATPGIDYAVMNTVVAAPDLAAANGSTLTQSAAVDRPDKASFFVRIPPRTRALRLTVHGPGGISAPYPGRVRLLRPGGSIGTPFVTGGPVTKTILNPFAGVWEAVVEASRISSELNATYFVTAESRSVTVDPDRWTVDQARVGTSYDQSFTFTNHVGEFRGFAHGGPLASAFASRPTIAAEGPPQVYDIVVPEGSTMISAHIENPSDPDADLDLSLFDCTSGSCTLRSRNGWISSDESVFDFHPAAGAWKVVVEPIAVPSGSTAYDYLDLMTNPAFGSVAVTDPDAVHPDGDVWSATATATADAAPGAGRFLRGLVQVRNFDPPFVRSEPEFGIIESFVLGEAEIQLKNVTP